MEHQGLFACVRFLGSVFEFLVSVPEFNFNELKFRIAHECCDGIQQSLLTVLGFVTELLASLVVNDSGGVFVDFDIDVELDSSLG